RSAACQTASSSVLRGNANGVNNGVHCLAFPKHQSAVLHATPRGSKPTMSNQARTSPEKRNGAAKRAKSTPEPPGPPGLMKIDPIRRAGSAAGSLTTAIEIAAPTGSE